MATRISPETAAQVRAAWPALLADIAGGALVDKAITAHGLKREWVRAFKREESGAQAEWDDAMQESAHAFMDEALEIVRNPVKVIQPGEPGNETGAKPLIITVDSGNVRARADVLRWAAAKRFPRAYSDKVDVSVLHKHLDLTRIIEAANARLAGAPRARILEHNQAPLELAAPALRLEDLL